MRTLKQLRLEIQMERPYVNRKPYSHNIISLVLHQIANEYGRAEANKAIKDFRLGTLGWMEEL